MGNCKNSSSIDVSFSKGAKSEKLTSITLQNKGKFVILRKVILNTKSTYFSIDIFPEEYLNVNIYVNFEEDFSDREQLYSCQLSFETLEGDEYIAFLEVADGVTTKIQFESNRNMIYHSNKVMRLFELIKLKKYLHKCGKEIKNKSNSIELQKEIEDVLKYLKTLSTNDQNKINAFIDKSFEEPFRDHLKLIFNVCNY